MSKVEALRQRAAAIGITFDDMMEAANPTCGTRSLLQNMAQAKVLGELDSNEFIAYPVGAPGLAAICLGASVSAYFNCRGPDIDREEFLKFAGAIFDSFHKGLGVEGAGVN